MDGIVFVGLQATGKSTYYKSHYFNSHVRISRDLLRTDNRERLLLEYCKTAQMPFVVDNTNVTKESRKRYISFCKEHGYRAICLYFRVDLSRSLAWNSQRSGRELVPEKGILGTHRKLELPEYEEGFDEIWYIDFEDNCFVKRVWNHEV